MIQFTEITEITSIVNEVNVNDLTVDNNHSYVANDYVVHNCITSSNSSTHYPMGSLVYNTAREKDFYIQSHAVSQEHLPKIIADGGIRNYSDVIKALALGADYVMIGGLFASLMESAGKRFALIDGVYEEREGGMYKKFYGMASKDGQIAINGKKTKTSEGITKYIPITGSLPKWVENMADYMRTTMSYCNIKKIRDLNPYNVETGVITPSSQTSINK